MTASVELSVGLLRRFAEFTRKLSPEELEGVVAGTLKFGLLEPKAPKPAKTVLDAEQVRARLAEMETRDAAREYLDSLKLTAVGMKQLAQSLSTPIAGVARKDDIRDRIVEFTVGFRRGQETIRHGSWKS